MGTTAGAVTLNPIVLGVVSGARVFLKTAAEIKNYSKKIQQAQFAYTTYAKTLSEIRYFLRGEAYDSEAFIQKMKVLDEIIMDLGLEYEKFSGKLKNTTSEKRVDEFDGKQINTRNIFKTP